MIQARMLQSDETRSPAKEVELTPRERRRLRKAAWNTRNREKNAAKAKEYYWKDPEKAKARRRARSKTEHGKALNRKHASEGRKRQAQRWEEIKAGKLTIEPPADLKPCECGLPKTRWRHGWRCEPCHKVKVKKAKHKNYQENREKIDAKNTHYRKTRGKAIVAAVKARYISKNIEKVREKDKQWNRSPNGRLSKVVSAAKRRLTKRNMEAHATKEELQFLRDSNPNCFYCKNPHEKMTFDHVTPISRGGTDTIDNIVMACHPCNSAKKNRTPEEWRAGIIIPVTYSPTSTTEPSQTSAQKTLSPSEPPQN